MNFPILKNDGEILKILKDKATLASKDFICFFSSHLGAYITNPIFMNIPIEDKIVHRGFAVFETTKIFQNKVYQLDKHIDRFMLSMKYINLNSRYSKSDYREILMRLASLARKEEPDLNTDIELRYYYSAGLGNFSVLVKDELNTFYAIAYRANNKIRPIDGVNEALIHIDPIKDSISKSKSTNYLLNSLVTKIAKDNGGYLGIMVDEFGNLLESPISNIAFVTKSGEFNVPPFDKTLVGTTVVRCMNHIEKDLIPNGHLKGITRDYMNISNFLERIDEMMLVGGDFVIPILKIGDHLISEKPGKITRILQEFLGNDKKGEEASEFIAEI